MKCSYLGKSKANKNLVCEEIIFSQCWKYSEEGGQKPATQNWREWTRRQTQQKKSQYQSKVINVIPPKFESNVHVSHAKAHATAAH